MLENKSDAEIAQSVPPLPIPPPPVAGSVDIELTEKNNGETIKAKVGDKVIVTLPFNPSNGFFWQNMGSSAGNLEEVRNEPASTVPGKASSVHFKFNVIRSGHIVLSYARPWAELSPPEKWFNAEITAG